MFGKTRITIFVLLMALVVSACGGAPAVGEDSVIRGNQPPV
jgi:predicted small secreted protein